MCIRDRTTTQQSPNALVLKKLWTLENHTWVSFGRTSRHSLSGMVPQSSFPSLDLWESEQEQNIRQACSGF
eukprot:6449534-Amphidinium_carterae.1